MSRLFIAEADREWEKFLLDSLGTSHELYFWTAGKDVFNELKLHHCDVVILDLHLQQTDPFDLLRWIRMTLPHTPVIIMSSTEKASLVVRTIKEGAFDFIAKPFSAVKIQHVVEQALEKSSLKNEIDYLRHGQDVIYDFDRIIAFSPIMKEIIKTLKKFAKTDSTILMTGDTGTGKSFLAGTIHFNSHRRSRPFVTINCANIPETLLESELFGHEKGAFTGADKLRVGRFEQARGGTLFLDEIGEISLSLQAKLLRVLDEKSFERVGGNQTIRSDVRVIAATNRNLEQQVAEGKFREDLYYRINILSVKLPPLRERKECIGPLASLLLEKTCTTVKKKIAAFSPSTIEWLKAYEWPGNIRQLANTIERAVILEEGSVIHKENIFTPEMGRLPRTPSESDSSRPLETGETKLILDALQKCLWIQKDAARLLGISPRALNYKIKKFGITHPGWLKNR
ncbi:MAG: sigma-54-dependent Fis family transcriptional regulator [Deltaproteobacteria bacterium]|nr:sigma-54-dependent Fis family transcriptional regulator [Deltaproteobacteria bacterium]